MEYKRGQAAMEFLITYGWAILAAIIAIGVLAFFLANPSRFTSNSFVIAAPFSGDDYQVNTTSVNIMLLNGAGETYTVYSINSTGTEECSWTGSETVASSEKKEFDLICNNALASGGVYRGDLTIIYMRAGGVFNQTVGGSIVYRIK